MMKYDGNSKGVGKRASKANKGGMKKAKKKGGSKKIGRKMY